MGTFSVWHWLIVLAVVLLLFGGGGKIPKLMKDMGSGINAFKKGLKDDEKKKAEAEAEDDDGEAMKTIEASSAAEDDTRSRDRSAANG